MRLSVRPALAGLVLGLLALGCSGSSGEGVVSGEVLLDNAPLPKGLVKFVPTDPKLRPADAEVKDGKFELRAAPGEYKVEISAPKITGKKNKMYNTPDSKEVEQIEELLPARFNTQSTLKMTVQSGRQEKKFEVQAK